MGLPKLETQTFTTKLPSTGKKVKFRGYTVKEEKTLLMANESGDTQAIVDATKQMMQSCIIDDIDVESLAAFDMEHMLLHIRGKSVGEVAELRSKCSECSVGNDIEVDVEDAYLTSAPKSKMVVQLTDTVGVQLKYPGIDLLAELKDIDTEAERSVVAVLGCIASVYDEEKIYKVEDFSREELLEFVDSLSAKQFKEIAELFLELPKLVIDVKYRCVNCGHNNEFKLEGLNSFFS